MRLYSENDSYKLYHGSMLDMLQVIPLNSIDSIVTDPPYELNFMGKSWDSSGIAFQKETWRNCYEVLKPGGYLLAFGGSRTFHRIACAIEDAGFEIRDTIMWLYGSGFPKSMNIGLAIDKKNGVDNRTGNVVKGAGNNNTVSMNSGVGKSSEFNNEYEERSATNEWAGWGSCLKPAFEPIIIARKPFNGSLVDNVITYGVGGLNIDECRVPSNPGEYDIRHYTNEDCFQNSKPKESKFQVKPQPDGRFPANVILTYDEQNREEVCGGFPQSGSGSNGEPYNYAGKEYNNKDTSMFNGDKPQAPSNYNDNGSAARYFYCAKESEKDSDGELEGSIRGRFPANVVLTYDETDHDEVCGGFPYKDTPNGSITNTNIKNSTGHSGIYGSYSATVPLFDAYKDSGSAARYFYCAKASKKDRNEGLDEFEDKFKPAVDYRPFLMREAETGKTEHNDFLRLGKTKNNHPTVKPTELMQYLIRLVTPNGGTVLDPFNGSGSTGKATMYENTEKNKGYKYIGIELTDEYLPISKARIEYAMNAPVEKCDVITEKVGEKCVETKVIVSDLW